MSQSQPLPVAVPIRCAGPADGAALWAILKPIFRAGDTYLIEPGIGRAAALDYWLGGTAFLAGAPEPSATYYLRPNAGGGGDHVCNCGFAVAPRARGRGLAAAMLDHALATARSRGFLAMQFNAVVATNTAAIALWQRAGFATIGRIPRGFRHPQAGFVDLLVMHRDLTGRA